MNEKLLDEIRIDARERKIPILMDDTLEYIMNVLKNREINSILEVGTAVAYSAICFSKILSENGHIDTIEIEEIRVKEANENIEKMGLKDRINVIHGNALEVLPKMVEEKRKYDYIFIDAAKGQYNEFYKCALEMLNDNGIIIADNVLYKGMVLSDYNERKHRTAVNKLRRFLEYIQNIEGIKSEILDIGDGISISYKI
ncbi:MAG: O-methyltransferase [Clostridiales bacterium]|nr:O-methyltransferase [Clostridiales bacterium]